MNRIRILLTGASGFIGQFLADYLGNCSAVGNNFHVNHAYRVFPDEHNISESQFAVGGINSYTQWGKALCGVDVVVHLAARVHVMHEMDDDPLRAFREVNTQGTMNLARQAVAAGVKRFIYLSSIKVNGENTDEQPFFADDIPKPQDPYAVSKYEAEQQLLALSKETGLEVVIIRPPLVYGPGVKGNFSRLINIVKKSIPLPFKGISNQRSFVSLQNLCFVIETCMTHPDAAGEIFLVSDGHDLSTSELFELIAKSQGQRVRLFYFPDILIRFFMRNLGFRGEYDRLFQSLQVDIAKNRKVLGWKPKISVQEGIKKVLESA